MSSPVFRLPQPALRHLDRLRSLPVRHHLNTLRSRAMALPAPGSVVATARERIAALQAHPRTGRILSSSAAIPGILAGSALGALLLVVVWSQAATLAGDLVMGNLLRLVAGLGVVFGAVLAVVLVLAALTGLLRFRGRWPDPAHLHGVGAGSAHMVPMNRDRRTASTTSTGSLTTDAG